MDELLIERLSWQQIKEAMARGYKRVAVAIGAMEQHGPHLPIGTDTFLGSEQASRLARALGNTLVSPAITVGWSEGHLSHPGTVNVAPDTLKTLILEYCRSLAHHGFKEIVLVPSHGGNYRPMREVLPRLREELPEVNIIAPVIDLDVLIEKNNAFYSEHNLEASKMGVHSGQGETSMMLAAYPGLVDMSKAVEGFTGDASIRWRAEVPPPMDTMSPTGILGDAREATAELGELLLERRINELVETVRENTVLD